MRHPRRLTDPAAAQTSELASLTESLARELRSESGPLLEQIERGLAEADDPLSEMELRSVGALLAKIKTEQAGILDAQGRELRGVADFEADEKDAGKDAGRRCVALRWRKPPNGSSKSSG